jgi:hypothetical protein
MTEHPITPPPELVQQWLEEADTFRYLVKEVHQYIATRAAQWGADQELEACCKALDQDNPGGFWSDRLRTARRPKPPSLKELALTALSEADQGLNESEWQQRSDTIRRALEQLDD